MHHAGPRCAATLCDGGAIENDGLLPLERTSLGLYQAMLLGDANFDAGDAVIERQVEDEVVLPLRQTADERGLVIDPLAARPAGADPVPVPFVPGVEIEAADAGGRHMRHGQ